MLDGQRLDPYTILDVDRDAAPQAIRDAYRRKSKKHHPDQGGDEWAFRIVARAYEFALSRAESEAAAPVAPPRPEPAAAAPLHVPTGDDYDAGQIRPGIVDKGIAPERLVLVEVLWMRYEVGDVMELIGDKHDDRNLSGSLNVVWPDPAHAATALALPDAPTIARELGAALEEVRAATRPLSARTRAEAERFESWLSYANGTVAWAAFKQLHARLKARGLGVRQWTRDLPIPRG